MADHVSAAVDPYENRNPIIRFRNRRGFAAFGVDVEKETIFTTENLSRITRDAPESTCKLRTE
jgi:hypothetical protein